MSLPAFVPAPNLRDQQRRVAYIDYYDVNWSRPDLTLLACAQQGFNVIVLGFWLSGTSAATDMAVTWQNWGDATSKATVMSGLHAGVNPYTQATFAPTIVLLSVGGASEYPLRDYGAKPFQPSPLPPYVTPIVVPEKSAFYLGALAGEWVNDNLLDGVDFDLEHFTPYLAFPGYTSQDVIDWCAAANVGANWAMSRGSNLKSGYITAAPQAPYLGPVGASTTWAGPLGGYVGVYKASVLPGGGAAIDWMCVQFYNQDNANYGSYETMFVQAAPAFPLSSVQEVTQPLTGVPLSALIVGALLTPRFGDSGYVPPESLRVFFARAKASLLYDGSAMVWAFADGTTDPSIDSGAWERALYGAKVQPLLLNLA